MGSLCEATVWLNLRGEDESAECSRPSHDLSRRDQASLYNIFSVQAPNTAVLSCGIMEMEWWRVLDEENKYALLLCSSLGSILCPFILTLLITSPPNLCYSKGQGNLPKHQGKIRILDFYLPFPSLNCCLLPTRYESDSTQKTWLLLTSFSLIWYRSIKGCDWWGRLRGKMAVVTNQMLANVQLGRGGEL